MTDLHNLQGGAGMKQRPVSNTEAESERVEVVLIPSLYLVHFELKLMMDDIQSLLNNEDEINQLKNYKEGQFSKYITLYKNVINAFNANTTSDELERMTEEYSKRLQKEINVNQRQARDRMKKRLQQREQEKVSASGSASGSGSGGRKRRRKTRKRRKSRKAKKSRRRRRRK